MGRKKIKLFNVDQSEELKNHFEQDGRFLLSHTCKSETKRGDSYDVLFSFNPRICEILETVGLRPAPLFGDLVVYKVSSKPLFDTLKTLVPEGPIDVQDALSRKRDRQAEVKALREAALQGKSRKKHAISKARLYTVTDPRVRRYVMHRIIIVSIDNCECCGYKSRHYTARLRATDFDAHHTEGRASSDTIYTAARTCGICHNAITRNAKDGPSLNMELRKKVLLAEYPEIKTLIQNELREAGFVR